MDLRYIMYANSKGKFYSPPEKQTKKTSYKMPKIIKGWTTEIDKYNHWRYYICKKNTLPEQGWKIHISAPIYAAQKILDICSAILIEQSVDFKYVDNEWELFLKNSKYGDRGGSGKFITVYPKSVDEFEKLIYMLDDALKGTPNGPYILSDKCWKDSNVFFRYGGIHEMYMDKEGSKVLAIKNINGEYMADTREPYYNLPDFIEEPEFIKVMDEKQLMDEGTSKLDDYDITGAIHFSNAGGVYTAKRKSDGKEVVLKEGRPESGLDGEFKDAHSRIYREAEMLDKLRDVQEVVHYYSLFGEWKHVFLEEEYINGISFNRFITLRYPFYKGAEHQKNFGENACIILKNAIKALEAIHNKNVGIGDLQPMNIMVNEENFSVKLIDFEAANDLRNKDLPALVTPGFASDYAKNRLQGDWYSMWRIARYAFLPIGPIQDIDEGIAKKHDVWIEKNFGPDVIKIILEVQSKLEKFFKRYKKIECNENYQQFWGMKDLKEITEKIRQGMIEDLQMDDILLGGDIRQFEEKGGRFNIKTGGFGVLMALNRTGSIPQIGIQWAEKYSSEKYLTAMNDGLYSGKSGVACVLYEMGLNDKAYEILSSIVISDDMFDVSLMNGLAGIGLALQSFYKVDKSEMAEKKILQIAKQLENIIDSDIKLTVEDPDALSIGLFNGWSGVALFYLVQYRMTNNKEWLNLAIRSLNKDLEKCLFDDNGVYQVDDNKRFYPYLDGGTLGIGMVILEIKKHLSEPYLVKELEGLLKHNQTRCCYNAGLFCGYTGFLAFGNSNAIYRNEEFSQADEMLETLNLYFIEENDKIYCPGNYSYKLSGDIFSGSAGVLLTLSDIANRQNFGWLPVIDVNHFVEMG